MAFIYKNPLVILCISFLIFFLMFFYYKQGEFSAQYDASYWKDRYEHSQYKLPLSKRGIGDDALYAYGGYTVVKGGDPTKIVFDKPAFGIVGIGIFIIFFNNPIFSGLFFGLGSLIVFYFLVKKLFADTFSAVFASTLFLFNPVFFSHLSLSLLDVMQLFFFLLCFYCFTFVVSFRKNVPLFIFLSAFFLGLSAQTKIPFFLPLVLIIQIGFILKKRSWKGLIFYGFGGAISLVLSSLIYLYHNYSFFDFLRIQKYIIAIYQASQLHVHPEAIWQFMFTGFFPNVSTREPLFIEEWTMLLPLITILALVSIVHLIRYDKKSSWVKGMGIFVLLTLVLLTVIPVYPRYVLIIFPFLCFFAVLYIKQHTNPKKMMILFLASIVYGLIHAFIFLQPKPDSALQSFYFNFSQKYFQDVYQENITKGSRPSRSAEVFFKDVFTLFEDAKIRAIRIEELDNQVSRFDKKGLVTIRVTYFTEYLGSFSETKKIMLEKENNIWKIVWNPEYLLEGYKPGYRVVSQRINGKRGIIYDEGGSGLGRDEMGYLISFNPSLMSPKQERSMLAYLSTLSPMKETHLQNAYLENVPKNVSIPLFTTYSSLFEDELEKIVSFKGVTYQPYPVRTYTNLGHAGYIQNTVYDECCTRIYSSYNYHGIQSDTFNPEYVHDKKLSGYDGGSLEMYTQKGERIKTFIKKNPKNGSEVYL